MRSLRKRWALSTVLFVGVAACSSEAVESGGEGPGVMVHHITDRPEIIASAEAGRVGRGADLLVAEDGSLFVSDQMNQVVFRWSPPDTIPQVIGRSGSGPGEFRAPTSMALRADTLLVVDSRNARVAKVLMDGSAAGSTPIDGDVPGLLPTEIGPDGTLVVSYLGLREALVGVKRPDGTRFEIGQSEGEPQGDMDTREMRRRALDGELPRLILNFTLTAVGEDETIWLMLTAQGKIKRHRGSDGHLLGEVELHEEEFDTVYAEWVDQYRAIGPEEAVIPALRYFRDAEPEASDLWVLISTNSSSSVVRISPGMELLERRRFSEVGGASQFAIDWDSGWVYFLTEDRTQVVRAPWGDE